jgi:hypothetical protein
MVLIGFPMERKKAMYWKSVDCPRHFACAFSCSCSWPSLGTMLLVLLKVLH